MSAFLGIQFSIYASAIVTIIVPTWWTVCQAGYYAQCFTHIMAFSPPKAQPPTYNEYYKSPHFQDDEAERTSVICPLLH